MFYNVANAAATCMSNGKEVPCPEGIEWLIILPVLMLGLLVFTFIFWLKMIIHAATHNIPNKGTWISFMIIFNLLPAIIYYYVVKKPLDQNKISSNPLDIPPTNA